jgi:glycosyltransferase involved in cell wall biosynthesis
VHVLYLIDSLIAGGAERSLAALAPWYRDAGLRLDVAYLYDRDNVWIPALQDAGADVVSLAGAGGALGKVRAMSRLIGERRPDVVHTTLFDADLVGRLAATTHRVPVACSLVNAAYGPEQLADPALKRWKVRAAQLADAATARRVTRFHAVSETVADAMAARLRVARRRIDVIPRGRDPEALGTRTPARRAAARSELGARDDDALLLAVGRHEFQKGFDVLIDAFATVRAGGARARLLVAGREGAATAQLRALASERGVADAVDFLGFRSDVPELLCAADVFVAPSRWEGSPGGILEAMALEVPIVAADVPAIREVLADPPCGTLTAVDDPGALAAAVQRVLDRSEPDRRDVARAAFLDRHSIAGVAAAMLRFYDRVAAGRR